MPYLQSSDQTGDVTKDRIALSDENGLQNEDEEIEDPPGPRRSTRSTSGTSALSAL